MHDSHELDACINSTKREVNTNNIMRARNNIIVCALPFSLFVKSALIVI